jgi:adenylate cyclase class 1
VTDERGSVLGWTTHGARESSVLAALAQFLRSVQLRQLAAGAPASRPAIFHALRRGSGGTGWSAERTADPAPPGNTALHVQALAGPDGDWTVYCDGLAFSQRELGDAFASRLSSHIRSMRRGGAEYPVYITDLDLSALEPANPPQTIEYLVRRRLLEQQLNAVLLP